MAQLRQRKGEGREGGGMGSREGGMGWGRGQREFFGVVVRERGMGVWRLRIGGAMGGSRETWREAR